MIAFWGGNSRYILGLLLGILFLATADLTAATHSTETRTYPAAPGDTLVVENDYGRIRIRAWNEPTIEAVIRRIAPDERSLRNVVFRAEKKGDRVELKSRFFSYQSESVYMDVRVPEFLNVVVWGAHPAVELTGIGGYVRTYTQSGLITAQDLLSSVSLTTESGDVLFESHIQPDRDIRLESIKGNIRCRLIPDLNLRGWIRAGDRLIWNDELEFSQGQLDKQVGVGGPLLYAGSLLGQVSVHFNLNPVDARLAADLESMPTTRPRSIPETASTESREPTQPRDRPVLTEPSPPSERADRAPEGGYTPDSESGQEAGGLYSLKVDVNWTYLNVSVRNRTTNRSVPNLFREDFEVYEDGQLQNIEKFESTEAPFHLLLLLDISGSTKSHMDLIKDASVEFTQQINSEDRIAVATFNSRTRLVEDFTNDRREVAQAIRRIRSGGGTAFYDALDRSVVQYMDGLEGRKAIVVFTDGVDNQLTGDYSSGSQISFRELFRNIQETDSIIYTIFLDTEDRSSGQFPPPQRGSVIDIILGDILKGPIGGGRPQSETEAYAEARRQLMAIAEQTGGRMYSPRDILDLSSAYREIADDLRVQYTLAYNSTNTENDGSWREVKVRVKDRRDLAVRTRKGYYATSG